jgi:hypothetical protein
MPIPLFPILALSGLGGLLYLKAESGSGGPDDPFTPANLPTGYTKGKALKTVSRTKNGRNYDVTLWDHSGGKQFVVARLRGSKSWVSYYHDLATKKRKLYRAYAAGNKEQADRAVTTLMTDWGVTK